MASSEAALVMPHESLYTCINISYKYNFIVS